MPKKPGAPTFYEKLFARRFFFLLGAQFFLIIATAFTQGTRFDEEIFLSFLCFLLLAGAYALRSGTRRDPLFLGIGLLAIAGNFAGYAVKGVEPDVLAGAINLIFLIWVMWLLTEHIFLGRKTDINTIVGAACLYILFGIAFGFVYMLVDYFEPGSFTMKAPPEGGHVGALLGYFFYYSFVTLATVGYGDIAPVSLPARYLSVMEAIAAQLYLTILVARLVGLHIIAGNHKNSEP